MGHAWGTFMASRDNFSKATKETLSKRVGNRCANPECRKLTSGPHSDPSDSLNIGVAGHITAASPSGPRYESSLTPEQRKSATNGIWLCQNCGKLVDNDASTYTVSQLNDWKNEAEKEALEQVTSNKSLKKIAAESSGIPPGVQDLNGYWTSLSSIGKNPLSADVFTTSRELEIQSVREWLQAAPGSLFFETVGLMEGVDFIAALSAGAFQSELQDALIIYTLDAWRQLASRSEGLFLVAAPNLSLSAVDVAEAVQRGHHVFVSGPRGIVAPERAKSLRRQNHYMVGEELGKCGYALATATSLAKASCGSSSILKRLVTHHPETIFPDWSKDDVRNALAPFALVGGWLHVDPSLRKAEGTATSFGGTPPADVDVVRELVGCDDSKLDDLVSRWRQGAEPLFVQLGNSVLVASREDAWYLLGSAVSEAQLKRFVDFAELLLSEDSPALELAPEERWLANVRGKKHLISEDLRKSLIETLALMSTYTFAGESDATLNFREAAEQVIARILPEKATWQRWASFGSSLSVMAEAAPELFLERVEADLSSESPEIPKLFGQNPNPLLGRNLQCDIIWALETLAWEPSYLARVAAALAKLSTMVPAPGNYTNHPQNSLREIFLTWLWHTNATREQRIAALSEIYAVEPSVGWRLILSLLPSGQSTISHNTAMPRWRPWAEGWSRERLHPELKAYRENIGKLALQLAENDPQKWAEALDGLLRIDKDTCASVLAALRDIANDRKLTEAQKFPLWKTLRELVESHEQYSDAPWAYPEPLRVQLTAIRDEIEPSDPISKHHWLFERQAELSKPSPSDDLEAHDKTLHEMRKDALSEIIAASSIEGVFKLIELSSNPDTIGWIAGYEALLTLEQIQFPKLIAHEMPEYGVCAKAFLTGAYSRDEMEFVGLLPVAEWTPHDVASAAACLPFESDIWNWVDTLGDAVKKEYWRLNHRYLRSKAPADVERAANALVDAGHPFSAIDVLHGASHRDVHIPTNLKAHVLESALFTQSSEETDERRNLEYAIQQLILALQTDTSFDRARLARIEWGFLPLLQREYSKATPDTLVKVITTDPTFFVDVLKKIYRGENESDVASPVTDNDRFAADRALDLLNELSTLPGTSDEGEVDIEFLEQWINGARGAATPSGHAKIFFHTLGEIIARATRRPIKEDWPPPEIASLMETVGDDSLFEGFVVGVVNSRGVSMRSPFDGGVQEHQLAQECQRLAETARSKSPKLSKAFTSLSGHYESDARREDVEAQRVRIGR